LKNFIKVSVVLHDDRLSIVSGGQTDVTAFGPRLQSADGTGVYQCRVCGEAKKRLGQAQRHVLSHFFAPEIARNIDLPEVL
jgi:hypothetical protein